MLTMASGIVVLLGNVSSKIFLRHLLAHLRTLRSSIHALWSVGFTEPAEEKSSVAKVFCSKVVKLTNHVHTRLPS